MRERLTIPAQTDFHLFVRAEALRPLQATRRIQVAHRQDTARQEVRSTLYQLVLRRWRVPPRAVPPLVGD